ncbi:MAG TPA: hypothetical protein VJG83_01410 [archaeon]|nr:hypothetical protein [archaeon]
MGVSESIGEIYSKIEEKFYGAMDFLQDKGVPVYSVIDPLEEHGIPFLPFAAAGAIALILILYGVFFLSTSESSMKLSIIDSTGNSLSGVSIKLIDEKSGKEIETGSDVFRDGQEVVIARGIGTKVLLEASKEGYATTTRRVYFEKAQTDVEIRLTKEQEQIEGSLRLVDLQTGDSISQASVVANFAGASVECTETQDGEYVCPGVFSDEQTDLTITQANYEQKNLQTKFAQGAVNEISLAPKPGAASGKTSIIVRVFDFDTKGRIGNFSLSIFDAKDNELISKRNETDGDGEQVEKIAKGTSVRIVVQKENYLTYDSGTGSENQTLRDEELVREIYLHPGKNALTVGVVDVTGRPLPQVGVLLFNSVGDLLGQKESALAGEVIFENLSTDETYFVSAWQDNFVPAVQRIILSEKNRLNLVLERGTATNSGSLTIYAVDEKSIALNDVTLNFLQEDANGTKPLGVPAQKTDVSGKVVLLAPLNSTIIVKATKGDLYAEGKVQVLETFRNELLLTLREPFSQVLLKILNESGTEVDSGIVSIVAGNEVLLEDEYSSGGVVFDPAGNNYVTVKYSADDGYGFEEEVFVQDQNTITVSKGGQKSAGTTPIVEYLGIFSVDGQKVGGLSKGIDYFLKFRVVYPQGSSQNGLHVRLGEDNVGFVDSQDAGILGFSASGAASFYGRSYSPAPSPGFEALDFENSGSEGLYNKWAELYFSSGDERIVKIRARAKETAKAQDIELHYRAWSSIAGKHYRAPLDSELGLDEYSQGKTALYATTNVEKIKILQASSVCLEELCASYKFVRSDGSEFSVDNFRPVIAGLYALDITLSPTEASKVTIKASTAKQKPKISFQGFGIDNFSQFPDINSSDTSIEVQNVSAAQDGQTNVRLYFKANEIENSTITLQLISGESTINKQFHFSIYRERSFALKTLPENIVFGQDFVILLQDSTGLASENAQIVLSNSSGPLQTIVGNAKPGNGALGRYSVKNTFDSGTVNYEVSADLFSPLAGTIDITKSGILEWSLAENYIVIQKSEKIGEKFIEIKNNSRQNIEKLSFEIEPVGTLPADMEIKVTPLSNLGPNSSQRIVLSAQYEGENESAHGQVRITAKGRTESGFSAIATTNLVADYNPKISAECVEFSKQKLSVFVASGFEDRGFYESQYTKNTTETGTDLNPISPTDPSKYYKYSGFSAATTESFTAKLAESANCQVELELTAQIVRRGKKSDGIEVEAEKISLSPQITDAQGARRSSDEIAINITNRMIRNYPGKEKFDFDIIFKGEGFEKTIPLEVFVWNPRYALQVSRNIELYLGPYEPNRADITPLGPDFGVDPSVRYDSQYSAQVPLFVRNVGEADIENVSFRVASRTSSGNVDVRVAPDFPIQFLKKGQSIDPPKTLLATATRNEKTTLLDVKELDITGVIDGTTFSFGPVIITSHISAAQCLSAIPGNVAFISTKTEGAISQPITLKNTCAEEVRILDISKPPIGNNALTLAPANAIVPPGREATFSLILEKRENFNGNPVPIYVHAFLPRSGTPIESSPIIVDVKIGKDVAKGAAATEQITLAVCEGTGKTKTLRFPVIASGNSPLCDSAYCDASQLSNYLADRLDEKIRDAEKQIQNRSAEIQKSDCSQQDLVRGFCTFDGLGVKKETFFVYFSHDNLSPAILQKSLEGKNSTVRSYRVDFFEGKSGGEYLGGFGKQIYLNSNLRGCGRYTVTLRGFVTVQGSRIVPDLMNIVVDIAPDEDGASARQITEQCLPNIQNVMNYLPRDEGLTKSQKYDSWAGMVEPKDASLETLAKDSAKSLFGSEQRAIQGSIGTNTLTLDLAPTEGYIVRVEMDKVQSDNPVNVKGFVRQSLGADEQLQKDILSEATQALRDLRESAGNIEGCIGDDESYMLLKSSKDLGKIALETKEPIPVQFELEACTDFNVTSNIRETVSIFSRKASQFDGITLDSPFFKPALSQGQPESSERITTVQIEKLDEKKNRFYATVRACVTGNSQLQQAQGKTVVLEAKRIEGEAKKPVEAQVGLEVCGIHPVEFLEKSKTLAENQKGEYYYATFVWKGEPNSILLSDFSKISNAQGLVNKADEIIDGKRQINKSDSPEIVAAKTKAGWSYLGGCAATNVVTGLLRPLIGWNPATIALNVLADCGIPFIHLMADVYSWAKVVDDIGKAVLSGIGQIFSWPFKQLFGSAGIDAEKAQGQAIEFSTQDAAADIFIAFGLEAAIKDSIIAYNRVGDGIYENSSTRLQSFSKARIVSENVAEAMVQKIRAEAFGGSFDPVVDDFMDDFRAKFLAQVDHDVSEAAIHMRPVRGGFFNDDQLKEIISKSAQKVGQDPIVLQNFAQARNFLNTTTPNTFVDKEAISKQIFDEVDKIPSEIPTSDRLGPVNLVEATKDPAKLRLQTEVINDLKRKATEAYAAKMGITVTDAQAAIGTRLDGITVTATEDFGPQRATIATTEIAAVSDTVRKEVLPNIEKSLTQKISENASTNSEITGKIISEELQGLDGKIKNDLTNFSAINPSDISVPTILEMKEETYKVLAEKMGVRVDDVKTLFGAELEGIISSHPTETAPQIRERLIEFYTKKTGISFSEATELLDFHFSAAGERSLEGVLGKKWGNIRGSLFDELQKRKENIAQKLKANSSKTIDELRNIVEEQLRGVEAQINEKITGSINETVTTAAGRRATTITNTAEHYFKVQVSKAEQEQALSQMRRNLSELTKEAIDNPGRVPELENGIAKKFQKSGVPKLTEAIKGKIDLKEGIPSIWGKGGLLFLKNLLKEGAFGALSNYVGLVLYDNVLDSALKNANYTPDLVGRDEELKKAGVGFFGQTFEAEAGTEGKILKYRTYRVSVTNLSDGRKALKVGLASIPAHTKKELVLNNCKNAGFDREVGASLPGLLPIVDNEEKFPDIFKQNDAARKMHVKIARNYLAPQPNGERFGAQINAAVAGTPNLAKEFNAQNSMNLEALVVSIGIVKSRLGNDPNTKSLYMFGCNVGDKPREGVYANARCAAEKMVKYTPTCKAAPNKPACFLHAYENDKTTPQNQKTSLENVSDEQFKNLYETWASADYAWKVV